MRRFLVAYLPAKPLEIGSRFAFVAHFLGRKLSYVYEVVALTQEEMVMRTSDGPFPMETTYRFHAITDNSTRMTLRNQGMPSGFSRLLAPFIAIMMRRENDKDLRALKKLIERRAQD